MDTYLWMAEFLHCPPETFTTLLISSTLIYNRKLEKKKKSQRETGKIIICLTYTKIQNVVVSTCN